LKASCEALTSRQQFRFTLTTLSGSRSSAAIPLERSLRSAYPRAMVVFNRRPKGHRLTHAVGPYRIPCGMPVVNRQVALETYDLSISHSSAPVTLMRPPCGVRRSVGHSPTLGQSPLRVTSFVGGRYLGVFLTEVSPSRQQSRFRSVPPLQAIAHQRPSFAKRSLRSVDADRRLFSEEDPRVIHLLTLPVVNAPLRDVRAASVLLGELTSRSTPHRRLSP